MTRSLEIGTHNDSPDSPAGSRGGASVVSEGSITVTSTTPPQPLPANWTQDMQGLCLGHYVIDRPLGVGGMAAVLLATDTQLDRKVALKILPPAVATDPDTLERFHHEARCAAKLDHENIARVFASGEDQGLHFIAFEYVEGLDLKSLIETRGKLEPREALPLIYQACLGLEHAATKGMVHRDIKPSNLVLMPGGKLKVIDMGLARNLDQSAESGMTRSGVTLGTFDYLSPEQAIDPRVADARSDIYSLGCTLYHLLTGKPPVPEGSPALKLTHHQNIKPTDPRNFAPGLSSRVVRFMEVMLAKKPADRFRDFKQLKDALEALAAREGIEIPGLVLPKRKRRKTLTPLLVAASLAIAGLLAFISFQNRLIDTPSNKVTDDRSADSHSQQVRPDSPAETTPPAIVAKFETENATPEELAAWLKSHTGADRMELVLHGDIDLARLGEYGDNLLRVRARELVIRSAHPGNKATLRYHHDGRAVSGTLSLLHVEAEVLKMDGIRFILDSRDSPVSLRGLTVASTTPTTMALDRCEWIQAGNTFDQRHRVTSIEILGGPGSTIHAQIKESVFLGFREALPDEQDQPGLISLFDAATGGQDAITRKGFVPELRIEQCLFGPHATAIRCIAWPDHPLVHDRETNQGASPSMPDAPGTQGAMAMDMPPMPGMIPRVEGDGRVTLINNSFLTGMGERVIALQESVTALIGMRRCLVASSGSTDKATLLFAGGQSSRPRFQGKDNRYYLVAPYFHGGGDDQRDESLPSFQQRLIQGKSGADDSLTLDASPWELERPLETLAEAEIALEPEKAASGNLGPKLATMFQPSPLNTSLRWQEKAGERFAGTERYGGVAFYKSADKKMATPTRRLVIAGMQDQTRNIHPSIDHALTHARSGDTILVHHDGPLPLTSVQIDRPGFTVTLRPDTGSRPELTWQPPGDDPSWLKLDGASVRLEDLPISLESPAGAGSALLAQVSRQGQLTLKDCLVTLKGDSRRVALAGMREPEGMVRAENAFRAAQPSRLVLDSCLVRGKGRIAHLDISRSLEVEIRQSAIAVAGGVFQVDVDASETGSPSLSARIHQSFILTGSSAILLRNRPERPQATLNLRTIETHWICLCDTDATLVEYAGTSPRKDKLNEIWGSTRSWYWKFSAPFVAKDPISGRTEDFGTAETMVDSLEISREQWVESIPAGAEKQVAWESWCLSDLAWAEKLKDPTPILPTRAGGLEVR